MWSGLQPAASSRLGTPHLGVCRVTSFLVLSTKTDLVSACLGEIRPANSSP